MQIYFFFLDAVFFLVQAHRDVVSIGGKQTYQCVTLRDFLSELAKAVKWNSASWDNLQRMYVKPAEVRPCVRSGWKVGAGGEGLFTVSVKRALCPSGPLYNQQHGERGSAV